MATVAKSKQLQRMLENPEFREAWDSLADELAKATNLIKQGLQPIGHEVGEAAQRVLKSGAALPEEI